MKRVLVDETLEEAKVLGIRSILALRDDPPRDAYRPANGADVEEDSNVDFKWAIDLVMYIRSKYGDYFCIGVAAYREGHSDLSYPLDQDFEHDLSYLIGKVKAGADFVMTQLFYDVTGYTQFKRMLRELDSAIFKNISIIPRLMPIQSFEVMERTAKLSHAKLPPKLMQRLEPVRGDDAAVKKVGVGAISE
jgi:methylenetetrahydrofolate reductase (NADPH)